MIKRATFTLFTASLLTLASFESLDAIPYLQYLSTNSPDDQSPPWGNGYEGSDEFSAHSNGHGNGNGNGNGNGKKSSNRAAGNTGNGYKNSAGVRAEGEATAYYGYEFFETDHFYNAEGDRVAIGSTIYLQNYTAFFEYGLTENDTLSANFNYVRIRQTNTLFPRIDGFRDIDLGWKRLIWEDESERGTSLLAVGVVLTVPAGTDHAQLKAIRSGKFAELLGLQYSFDFLLATRPAGIDMAAGYKWYQGYPSDAVVLGGGFRWEFLEHLLFIASFDFYDSVGNGRPLVFPAPGAPIEDLETVIDEEVTNFTINNSRFLTGSLYLCYTICNISITGGTYRNLWGRNIGAQTGYFAGLTVTF